jgi:phospholipid transport system substrate-binding protein
VAAAAICLLCLVGWGQAWAGTPTDQLKTSVDNVLAVLQDPKLKSEAKAAERRAAIRQQAESEFDFNETAKRALGRHWQELSESQRKEFVSLFAELIERAYINKIEKYSGEPIVYVGESVEGDLATVRTKFVTKQGTEIPIDYRLYRKGDRWLVYDVLVEGVSLVANYRTQFDRILRTSGYDELVRRMKAAEFGPPEKSRTPRS